MNEVYINREKDGLGDNHCDALIEKAVSLVTEAEKILIPCIVSVTLTDNDGIRNYNSQFRGIEKETDVLSFPMNELKPGDFNSDFCEKDPETGAVFLGDIVISVPKCREQGEEFGHGFDREIMYLTVHSMLHLLGYDHMDEGVMKQQMRQREKIIMGDEE